MSKSTPSQFHQQVFIFLSIIRRPHARALVLVEIAHDEAGADYLLKRFDGADVTHGLRLSSLNPQAPPVDLPRDSSRIRVIAEFMRTIEAPI